MIHFKHIFAPEKDDFKSASYLKHLKFEYGDQFDKLYDLIKARLIFPDYLAKKSEVGINLAAYAGLFTVQTYLYSGNYDDWDAIIGGVSFLPTSWTTIVSVRTLVVQTLKLINEIKMANDVAKETASNDELIKAILFLNNLMQTDFVVTYKPFKPRSGYNLGTAVALVRLAPKNVLHVGENLIFSGTIPETLRDETPPYEYKRLHSKMSSLNTLMHFEQSTNFEKFSLVIWMGMSFSTGTHWSPLKRIVSETGAPEPVEWWRSKKVIFLVIVFLLAIIATVYFKFFYNKNPIKHIAPIRRRPPPLPVFEDPELEVDSFAKSAYFHG